MAKREIKASDIVKDIRGGLDDAALMHKYMLSTKGLQNLFDELAYLGYLEESEHRVVKQAKRRISAVELSEDIRSGLPVAELLQKYNISLKGLKSARRKLIKAGFLEQNHVLMDPDAQQPVTFQDRRKFERNFLDFDLPIIDANAPEERGRVRDITESGVGVVGIPAQVDEVKTLLIMHNAFSLITPFLFDARCRWVKKSEETGEIVAGFQITNTADHDREQLRMLARIVGLKA